MGRDSSRLGKARGSRLAGQEKRAAKNRHSCCALASAAGALDSGTGRGRAGGPWPPNCSRSEPRACCSLPSRPAARVREDQSRARAQVTQASGSSRKGRGGEMCSTASSARARTPPQRKETDPPAPTHVAPAPRAPSSLPTPTPSPYPPKYSIRQKSAPVAGPRRCRRAPRPKRDARRSPSAGDCGHSGAPPRPQAGPRGPPAAALASPRVSASGRARQASALFLLL